MEQAQKVSSEDRKFLRDLGRRYLEYANLPVMAERAELWYLHNSLQGPRPMVVFETFPVLAELMPPMRCTSPLAKQIEWQLLSAITNFQRVGDDKVISPDFRISWQLGYRQFDLDVAVRHAADEKGREIGFAIDHPVKDLSADLPKLKHSTYQVDRQGTYALKAAVEDVLGDLMPVRVENTCMHWVIMPSHWVVRLMGMEAMLLAMIDQPDALKQLYRFVTDDLRDFVLWQEREGLLTPNNGNDYAGAGSYGFCRELGPGATVSPKDLWGNLNSQETVGISPAMFQEFAYPSYHELAGMFGLTYFGCCEPVHAIWDGGIEKLPNLRKVSISPWCDEPAMGQRLRGGRVIYSRKPRPNFIGVGRLDEEAFAAHISRTLSAARGCHLEIIFRDIYTLDGDGDKPGKAVGIVRRLFDAA